ncbi:MAG: TerB family tellurite resistance protein [Pirellulaceae bacterium]|nr:TerB family tellurite resistance protein [Pirellulaceae bacterium]
MINTACPHCRHPLQVDPSFAGKTLRCPYCQGGFVGPSPPHRTRGKDTASQPSDGKLEGVTLAVMLAGAHFVAFILLAIRFGMIGSFFLVLLALLIELAVWQRKPLLKALDASVRAAEERRQAARRAKEEQGAEIVQSAKDASAVSNRTTAGPTAPTTRVPPTAAKPPGPPSSSPAADEPGARVVELRFPKTPSAPRTVEAIPPPRPSYGPWLRRQTGPSLNQAGARLTANIAFFGPGTQLVLDRATIATPLVYATSEPAHGTFDASLIDGSLPVASPGCPAADELPYWPCYHSATPQQRSRYLDWLAGGRRDPAIEIGYVFIYFYGLERRVLVDAADHATIAEEVLRLQAVFNGNRSFRRYSTSFLWYILAISGKHRILNKDLVDRVIASTERWDEECLGRCLAYVHEAGCRLPAALAYVTAQLDHRTPSSVIIRRHQTLFQDLFGKRYQRAFGEGMELRASKRSKPLSYQPASGTLSRLLLEQRGDASLSVPDVLAITSQFKPLVDIWTACIEELRTYDKAHRTAGGTTIAAIYESLPPELREGEHPEFDTWMSLWTEHANADGVPLVPVHCLAALKGFSQRNTLLKTQCQKLLATADCLGIGVEPDARLTGRNYRWDDRVTLFFLEDGEAADSAAYQAAACLLRLGLLVAAADGQVQQDEINRITNHLEDQFELTPNQTKRLECLRLLLLATELRDRGLFAALKQRLSPQQRLLVGEYLVGVAAADQVISHTEMKFLERAFRELDLRQEQLQNLSTPFVAAQPVGPEVGVAPPEVTTFHLDTAAISRIMHDTKAVAAILQEAMAVDEDSAESPGAAGESLFVSAPPSVETPSLTGDSSTVSVPGSTETPVEAKESVLPERFRPFFQAICLKSEWSEEDAKQLARSHQVMLSGAIEAINEWAQDRWGDWLVEEGEPLVIRKDLLDRD